MLLVPLPPLSSPAPLKSRRQEVGTPSLNAAQPYAKAEGRVFLLVPAYPGCPGTKTVKWLLVGCLGVCIAVATIDTDVYCLCGLADHSAVENSIQ